jgi:aminopeptidase N
MVLSLPSEGELGLSLRAEGHLIDVDTVYAARKALVKKIAVTLRDDFKNGFMQFAKLNSQASDGVSMGKRSLKNLCLTYLMIGDDTSIVPQILAQATKSKNMTDTVSALGILGDAVGRRGEAKKALKMFEKRWKKVPTVMDKWFSEAGEGFGKGQKAHGASGL